MNVSRIDIKRHCKDSLLNRCKRSRNILTWLHPKSQPWKLEPKHNLTDFQILKYWTLRHLSKRVSINTAASSWQTHRSPACRSHPDEKPFYRNATTTFRIVKEIKCFQNWQRNYHVYRIGKEIIMFSELAKELLCFQNCQRNYYVFSFGKEIIMFTELSTKLNVSRIGKEIIMFSELAKELL